MIARLTDEQLIEIGTAAVEWAEDNGECFLCEYGINGVNEHDEDCLLVALNESSDADDADAEGLFPRAGATDHE